MHNARLPAIATALAVLALSFGAFAPAAAADLANVANVANRLHGATAVPVLLPRTLPNGLLGGAGNRLRFDDASRTAYDVSIVAGRSCADPSCRLGFMRGMRAPDRPLVGRAVTLPGGGRAYYVLGSCNGACAPSTLAWNEGRYRYVLGIRGASINALRFAAASVARYRP
jgi:hypothetical protein